MNPRQRVTHRVCKPSICRPELDAEPFGQRQIMCVIGSRTIELSCKFHRTLVIVQLIIIGDRKAKGRGKCAFDDCYRELTRRLVAMEGVRKFISLEHRCNELLTCLMPSCPLSV